MRAHILKELRSLALLTLISISTLAIHDGPPSAANAQVYAGRLELNPGERWFDSAVIDTANGYAYFGGSGRGMVIKVSLSDFTRIGALMLNPDEQYANSAIIDAVNGYAYFGTHAETVPPVNKVIKVSLSDFTRVNALILDQNETPSLAVIDVANGFAYFGASAHIVKVRLSDFTIVGRLPITLPRSIDGLASAVIDLQRGFAYLGARQGFGESPSVIARISLSDFTNAGSLSLDYIKNGLTSAVIDTTGGYAYFGTWTDPGIIVKVSLSNFALAATLPLNPGESYLQSAVLDPVNGYAYFGTGEGPNVTPPGKIIKVRLSDFRRAGALDLYPIENTLKSAVVDPQRGFAYFGTVSAVGPGGFGKGIIVRIGIAAEAATTATTVTSPTSPTTTTGPTQPIPGFGPESIAIGLVFGAIALLGLRRMRRRG